MNENIPSSSREHAIDTRRVLKHKAIKSPVIKDMTYFIYDKRTKAMYFFRDPEKYIKRYKDLTKESLSENFKVSHPDLCQKTTSISEN